MNNTSINSSNVFNAFIVSDGNDLERFLSDGAKRAINYTGDPISMARQAINEQEVMYQKLSKVQN